MSDSNERTIASYETHVPEYLQGTPTIVSGVDKEWLDSIAMTTPQGARILELGSGPGRDALYLQSLGYSVLCSDATPAFVQLLQKEGLQARQLNAITDEIGGPYDLIFAKAVLLHFTTDEVKHVLQKVLAALRPGGTFAFSIKQGTGEQWSESKLGAPRYYRFWEEAELREIVTQAGFVSIILTGNQATNHARWIQVLAQKSAVHSTPEKAEQK